MGCNKVVAAACQAAAEQVCAACSALPFVQRRAMQTGLQRRRCGQVATASAAWP